MSSQYCLPEKQGATNELLSSDLNPFTAAANNAGFIGFRLP